MGQTVRVRRSSEAARPAAFLALLVCLLALGALAPAARAAPDFSIKDAQTNLRRGIYYLDADLHLALNRRARDALANGVPLTFVVQIHVIHGRKLLWNAVVAELAERYRLSYLPLSERYQIKNLNSGSEDGYDSLAAALAAIGRIRDLPVIDASLLDKDARYLVAMRVVLDTAQLPAPLKLVAVFMPGWQLESHWRQWVLQP